MKASIVIMCIAIVSMCSTSVLAATDATTIVKKADEILYGKSAYMKVGIEIYRSGKMKNSMVLEGYMKGSDNMLLYYLEPLRSKNDALLKLGIDMWIFFSKQKQFLNIGSRQSLGGSEFSYGDILNINLSSDYDATLADDTSNVSGYQCYRLNLLAKKENVTYSKIVYFIRKSDNGPVKREFFTKSGQKMKELVFQEFNGARPAIFRMKNCLVNTDDYSVLKTMDLQLNKNIDDMIFTKNYVSRGK